LLYSYTYSRSKLTFLLFVQLADVRRGVACYSVLPLSHKTAERESSGGKRNGANERGFKGACGLKGDERRNIEISGEAEERAGSGLDWEGGSVLHTASGV